jgi:hypothetical protein
MWRSNPGQDARRVLLPRIHPFSRAAALPQVLLSILFHGSRPAFRVPCSRRVIAAQCARARNDSAADHLSHVAKREDFMAGRKWRALAGVAALAAAAACGGTDGVAEGAPAADGLVTMTIPTDLTEMNLAAAADFAWKEFIALNWPAADSGRGAPDDTAHFGNSTTRPLVWHTYRSKIEAFPTADSTPQGYMNDPGQDYGWDAPRNYVYENPVGPYSGTPSTSTPWINLDENDEIGLDAMYAGTADGLPFPGSLILFTAKVNRAEYVYVAANQLFNQNPARQTQTAQSVITSLSSPPAGSTTLNSFPNGTIELKAGWRQLTPTEAGSGRFYQTRVRYYRLKVDTTTAGDSTTVDTDTTYVDATMGLVALHIIHKTPSQPHFVFATFEQADNLLDAQGNRVEDDDGNLTGYALEILTDPTLTSRNAQNPAPGGYTPSNIQQLGTILQLNGLPGQRLYYRNAPGDSTSPQGPISINLRAHGIPDTIIQANQRAHGAIRAYATQNGTSASPWEHYKLVNVQYKPLTKPDSQAGMPYTGADSATYYLANSVVETDYNLQNFSGMFQHAFPGRLHTTSGLITDWCGSNLDIGSAPLGCFSTPADTSTDTTRINGPFHNVYFNRSAYNMGGCMGCHGNAQVGGSDFSFLLAGAGYPKRPSVADPVALHEDWDKHMRLLHGIITGRLGPGMLPPGDTSYFRAAAPPGGG